MSAWTFAFALAALSASVGAVVLARRCAALERRVAELKKDFDGANDQLEIFTGAMSDELQAPLREIHRIGRTPLAPETVDMGALVHEILDSLQARYPRSTIRVLDLPQVRGDAALLRRAWTHLVENALKFSASAQSPKVEVGGHAHDREVEYWVRDNGTGFDMAHRHRLFEVFQRLHTAEEFAGAGTGLAMVRLIVGRHGGSVRAQAKPGEGATFTMLLPNPPPAT